MEGFECRVSWFGGPGLVVYRAQGVSCDPKPPQTSLHPKPRARKTYWLFVGNKGMYEQ